MWRMSNKNGLLPLWEAKRMVHVFRYWIPNMNSLATSWPMALHRSRAKLPAGDMVDHPILSPSGPSAFSSFQGLSVSPAPPARSAPWMAPWFPRSVVPDPTAKQPLQAPIPRRMSCAPRFNTAGGHSWRVFVFGWPDQEFLKKDSSQNGGDWFEKLHVR